MNNIIVKMYGCNKITYGIIVEDILYKLYKDKVDYSIIIVDLSENNTKSIQSQKSPRGPHSRTIEIWENNKIRYLVGVSNTNYDLDIIEERKKTGRKMPNEDNYHANTFLLQGINKIFSRFFLLKKDNSNLELYFYLLDIDKSYVVNQFNLISYRKLWTLGFKILNINDLDLSHYTKLNFYVKKDLSNFEFSSFNNLMNTINDVGEKNYFNMPSYIDEIYDEQSENVNYKFIFKSLSAQQYDSLLNILVIDFLSKKENKKVEFVLSIEKYENGEKETKDLSKPVKNVLKDFGIKINYIKTDEVLQDNRILIYEKMKENDKIRNQTFYRSNLRKNNPIKKCQICGCEDENELEASHIYGIAHIKLAESEVIDKIFEELQLNDYNMVVNKDNLEIINVYNSQDFYKRYLIANSGLNGIWLCKYHHKFFDSQYFCFNDNGSILHNLKEEEANKIFKINTSSIFIDSYFLEKRKILFEERKKIFLTNKDN